MIEEFEIITDTRSTSKTDKPHSALQIITAYLTEKGVVLEQEKINEIPYYNKC